MLKTIICTIALIFTTSLLFSQDYAKQFKEFSSKNDTSAQAKVLNAWSTASPEDAELFIAYFNYYLKKSRTEVVSVDKTQKDKSSFVISDTGTGEPVGYLNSYVKYNPEILQKGFGYLDRAIVLYPTRLDIRFGKIYMLGEVENYSEFKKEIIATIEFSNKINNAWLWKEGRPLENPERFFLNSLQGCVETLYYTDDDKLLPLIRQISETVIKYYPEHVESLSNIALTYLIAEKYDQALSFLLKAEQVAPKDVVVLNNIAEAYRHKGDKLSAKKYYEKIIMYGDKDEEQNAKRKIKSL